MSQDDSRTVEDYGIHSDSNLTLFVGKMRIPVNVLNAETFTIDVKINSTVDQMKATTRDQQGYPMGQQRLIYASELMKAGKRLSDYRLQEDSVVDLTLHLGGGMRSTCKWPAVRSFAWASRRAAPPTT